jgi:hypothetical protein
MKTKFPKYRVSHWLDTSPESMNKPEADIWYGVQTQRETRGPWMHVSINGVRQLFKTAEEADACIRRLQAGDSEKPSAAPSNGDYGRGVT